MPAILVISIVTVQGLGLAGLGWAKMSEGTSNQAWAQRIFFAALLMVAATAAIAATLGSPLWPVCCLTCGMMVLGATISSHRELESVL